jgi:hypothetical protein
LHLIAVLVVIATVGLATVGDYGFSTDESVEMYLVWENYDLVVGGKPITSELQFYGPAFDIAAELAFRAQSALRGVPYRSVREYGAGLRERVALKHHLTFALALLAYVAVAGLVALMCGLRAAWLGPLVLALLPQFWGHGFFNPKDAPFAALFTCVTLAGAYVAAGYAALERRAVLGPGRLTLATLGYGLLIGLLCGIRVGGIVVLGFTLVAHAALLIPKGKVLRRLLYAWQHYALLGAACLGATILLNPASWGDPLVWLAQALAFMSNHPWSKPILFEGGTFYPRDLPRRYLPAFVAMSVPLMTHALFVLGLALVALRYGRLDDRQRAGVALVLLQIFFLPVIAIARHSTMYSGMRQFIFVLPGIAVIAAVALVWWYRSLRVGWPRALLCAAVVCAGVAVVADMAAIHPYEYAYFNRAAGGIGGATKRYETDYWGLSLREAAEWLNARDHTPGRIVVGGSPYGLSVFADPRFAVSELDYDRGESMPMQHPFYYVALPRYGLDQMFHACPIVHQVTRQGGVLAVVRRCS